MSKETYLVWGVELPDLYEFDYPVFRSVEERAEFDRELEEARNKYFPDDMTLLNKEDEDEVVGD